MMAARASNHEKSLHSHASSALRHLKPQSSKQKDKQTMFGMTQTATSSILNESSHIKSQAITAKARAGYAAATNIHPSLNLGNRHSFSVNRTQSTAVATVPSTLSHDLVDNGSRENVRAFKRSAVEHSKYGMQGYQYPTGQSGKTSSNITEALANRLSESVIIGPGASLADRDYMKIEH